MPTPPRRRALAVLAGTATALLATSIASPAPVLAAPASVTADGPDSQPATPATPGSSRDATARGKERGKDKTTEERMAHMRRSRAGSSYDQLLVQVADPATATEKVNSAAAKVGVQASVVRSLATGPAVVRNDAADEGKAAAFMTELAADPEVKHVTPDLIVTASDGPDGEGTVGPRGDGRPGAGRPNDPLYPAQWYLFERRAGINLPPARALTTGEGVRVAVIDTGFVEHPDLDPNVVAGYDFISDPAIAQDGDGRDASADDPGDFVPANTCGNPEFFPSSWHGTHTAGIIGAVTDNRRFIASVAPDTTLQPVRVLGRCGGRLSDLIDAIVWSSGGAVPGTPDNPTPAQVINLSLGGQADTCDPALQQAIDAATGRGATMVVAAGNENADARTVSPANCDNVVTVGALSRAGNRAFYSNFGPAVDLTAPGGETDLRIQDGILSIIDAGRTTPTGPSVEFYNGTSEATPQVAGVAALVQAGRVDGTPLTPAELEQALKDSARAVPGACPGGCGAGLLDAGAAVTETLPEGSDALPEGK